MSRIVDSAEGETVGVLLLGRYKNSEPKNLQQLQENFPSLKLRFKTVHGSKGLEDDYVVVLDLKAGRMGFPTGVTDDALLDLVLAAPEAFAHAEERRLFYVALTRSKRAVFLLTDGNAPSSFVVELEDDDYDVETFGGDPRADAPCPECKEGKIKIRKGANGVFFGCSFYRLCEHKEPACTTCEGGVFRRDGDRFTCTNPECDDEWRICPKCMEGRIVQKNRRDGTGVFLGCSKFPTCRLTASTGVLKDDAEAAKWYREYAEQGHAVAQTILGLMYFDGRGVPQDLLRAHIWFSIAAAQGDEKAKRSQAFTASEMTPDQIAEAQRMAREWMAKHQQ